MKTQMRIRICLIAGMLLAGEAVAAARFDPTTMPFGTISPVSLSGFNLSTGKALAFQPWFENQNWSGDVIAKSLSITGQMIAGPAIWSAQVQLDSLIKASGHTARKIVTIAGTSRQEFLFANLSAAQQTAIGSANVVNYVRGDRSMEKEFFQVNPDGTNQVLSGSPSGIYRARASAMGDVIHGRVIYVGAPPGK